MSSAKKNSVSRLFADIDEVDTNPPVVASPAPVKATPVRVAAKPKKVVEPVPEITAESAAEAAPEPVAPVSAKPVEKLSQTATKHKVEGVKTRRARGRLAGFRAAFGVQIVLPLPQNVHAAYTRVCAEENMTLQSGAAEEIRRLVEKSTVKPEVLSISEVEADTLADWVPIHGAGYLRLVIPREVSEAIDALPFKSTPDGEAVSRKNIAARAVLNLVKGRLPAE